MNEGHSNPDGNEQSRVGARELGRLLRAFRRRLDKSQADVEGSLNDAVKQRFGGTAQLEEGIHGFINLSTLELEYIADAWGIPKLMLDPLLSERVDEVCLVENL